MPEVSSPHSELVRRVLERDGRYTPVPSEEFPDKDMALAALRSLEEQLEALQADYARLINAPDKGDMRRLLRAQTALRRIAELDWDAAHAALGIAEEALTYPPAA